MSKVSKFVFPIFLVASYPFHMFAEEKIFYGGGTVYTNEGYELCEEYVGIVCSAEYPGGDEAFVKYLREKTVSKKVLQQGWTGTVVVQFQIDTLGNVTNLELVKSVVPFLDAQVVNAVKGMQKWTPQQWHGGSVVSGVMRVLASFKIRDGNASCNVRFWRKDIFGDAEKDFNESIERSQAEANAKHEEHLRQLQEKDASSPETAK